MAAAAVHPCGGTKRHRDEEIGFMTDCKRLRMAQERAATISKGSSQAPSMISVEEEQRLQDILEHRLQMHTQQILQQFDQKFMSLEEEYKRRVIAIEEKYLQRRREDVPCYIN